MKSTRLSKLPDGTLKHASELTGLPSRYLGDLASTRRRPGRKRAVILERQTGIPAAVWLLGGADEIRRRLIELAR